MNRDRQTRQREPVRSDVIRFADSAGRPMQDEREGADYPSDVWPGRLPSSRRRYYAPTQGQRTTLQPHRHQIIQTVPPRRSALPAQQTEDLPAPQTRRRHRFHWTVYAGIGAMVALLLWAGAAWTSDKWQETQNDWTYTLTFRTFSTDQAVGHDGDSQEHPSHFIVQNDHRRIIIIEFPANDTSKAVIYAGPVLLGDGQEKTPVTLNFQLNPHTNRLDMVLHVEDQSYTFANNGTKFLEPTV